MTNLEEKFIYSALWFQTCLWCKQQFKLQVPPSITRVFCYNIHSTPNTPHYAQLNCTYSWTWYHHYPFFLTHLLCSCLGASIYDIRTGGGGGPQKADKRNNISWFVTVTRGGGGQKIWNFCGRHIWKLPSNLLHAKALHSPSRDPLPRRVRSHTLFHLPSA